MFKFIRVYIQISTRIYIIYAVFVPHGFPHAFAADHVYFEAYVKCCDPSSNQNTRKVNQTIFVSTHALMPEVVAMWARL